MSTTTSLDVAMEYCASKNALILRLNTASFMERARAHLPNPCPNPNTQTLTLTPKNLTLTLTPNPNPNPHRDQARTSVPLRLPHREGGALPAAHLPARHGHEAEDRNRRRQRHDHGGHPEHVRQCEARPAPPPCCTTVRACRRRGAVAKYAARVAACVEGLASVLPHPHPPPDGEGEGRMRARTSVAVSASGRWQLGGVCPGFTARCRTLVSLCRRSVSKDTFDELEVTQSSSLRIIPPNLHTRSRVPAPPSTCRPRCPAGCATFEGLGRGCSRSGASLRR